MMNVKFNEDGLLVEAINSDGEEVNLLEAAVYMQRDALIDGTHVTWQEAQEQLDNG